MNSDDKSSQHHDHLAKALTFLSEFTDYEQKNADSLKRDSLDLGRMWDLAARLNDPQDAFPSIHIAGSKGKGSTTLIVESILLQHGVKTGRFLSPHLTSPTERIAISGGDVSPQEFSRLVDKLRPLVAALRSEPEKLPSFFESITLMAFLAFAEADIDLAIIETGLGGRLDATNIVDPRVSIITMIDLEHTRVLGDTEAQIAGEKAGIIKEGRPVICGHSHDSAAGETIEKTAKQRAAPISWLEEEIQVTNIKKDGLFQIFDFAFQGHELTGIRLKLLGPHQIRNTALALAATITTSAQGIFDFNADLARLALSQITLPARVEYFAAQSGSWQLPFPLLLDSAHTPRSMKALGDSITKEFPNQKRALLVGLLRDKDVENCFPPLKGLFDLVFVVEPESPRAMLRQQLAERLSRTWNDGTPTIPLDDWRQIIPEDLAHIDLLVVTGSVYLAGAVRQQLLPVEDFSGRG